MIVERAITIRGLGSNVEYKVHINQYKKRSKEINSDNFYSLKVERVITKRGLIKKSNKAIAIL